MSRRVSYKTREKEEGAAEGARGSRSDGSIAAQPLGASTCMSPSPEMWLHVSNGSSTSCASPDDGVAWYDVHVWEADAAPCVEMADAGVVQLPHDTSELLL
ncbi:hypothetical protein EON62_02290, partial [archaeon]